MLGLKWLREPDLWWQLHTGRQIIDSGSLSFVDHFSYSYSGTTWINVKWLTEVVMAVVALGGSPSSLLLLQVAANVLIVLCLWKILNSSYTDSWGRVRRIVIFLVTTLLLLICEYRMNGRPEWVSHVSTIFMLLLLLRYLSSRNKKYLTLMILLQIAWTNMHEAYAIGLVLIGMCALSCSISEYLIKRKLSQVSFYLIGTALVAWLATSVHPFGTKMLLHPLNILSQVSENKYTSELLGIGYSSWWQKESVAALAVIAAAATALVFFLIDSKGKDPKVNLLLLITIGFSYLAIGANRNIVFIGLTVLPLLFHLLPLYYHSTVIRQPIWNAALPALGIALMCSIGSNFYYRNLDDGRDRYGLGIDPYSNPIATANIALPVQLSPTAIFSDYLTSSYYMANVDGFKTLIDLRDLDIFPSSFFDSFYLLVAQPSIYWPEWQQRYNWKQAIVYNNSFEALHTYLISHPEWKLVGADIVASVYSKSEDTLFNLPPDDHVRTVNWLPRLFYPPYNDQPYNKLPKALGTAVHIARHGEHGLAKILVDDYLATKVNPEDEDLRALALIYSYMNSAEELRKAGIIYQKLLAKDSKDGEALKGLGRLYFKTGDIAQAENYALKALRFEKRDGELYLLLAELQKKRANAGVGDGPQLLETYISYMKDAHRLLPTRADIELQLGIALAQSGDCAAAIPHLQATQVYATGYDAQLTEELISACGYN